MTDELDRLEDTPRRADIRRKTELMTMLNETGLGYDFSLEVLFDMLERAEVFQ